MIPLYDDAPRLRAATINWLLIVANVCLFLVELAQGDHINAFVNTWAVNPHRFLSHMDTHEIETIFSGMFMHGGWMHLIGNMWALWIFGDNVEDRMGHARYLLFYLVCGVAAALAQIFASAAVSVPALGASGAIAGVMAAYLVYFPEARVVTWFFIFIIGLPAWFVVGEWFVVQLINGGSTIVAHSAATEGIAWFAHVGGFVVGFILARLFEDPNYPRPRTYSGRILERVH